MSKCSWCPQGGRTTESTVQLHFLEVQTMIMNCKESLLLNYSHLTADAYLKKKCLFVVFFLLGPFIIILFYLSSPRACLLILERGREGETEVVKHGCARETRLVYVLHTPRLGTKPTTGNQTQGLSVHGDDAPITEP